MKEEMVQCHLCKKIILKEGQRNMIREPWADHYNHSKCWKGKEEATNYNIYKKLLGIEKSVKMLTDRLNNF